MTFFFLCERSLRSSGSFFFSQMTTPNIDTTYKTINIQASGHLSVPAGTKKRARNRPIEKINRTNFTILEDFVLDYERSNIDVAEHRLSNYGAYETYRKDTNNLIPGADELIRGRSTESRGAKVPVISRHSDYTTSATRNCTADDDENTSTFVEPSWTTIETGFQVVPAQYEGNYIKMQADFNRKMIDVQRTFLTTLDTAAYTNLNTAKSAVNAADGNPYTIASNAMIVPEEDGQLVFNELAPILEANDLFAPFNVVGSTRLQALVREYSSQGTANAENRAFQFGDYSFAYSNRVTVPTGFRDTIFCMPVGTLAYLSWIDPTARMGAKGGKYEWTTQSMPLLGHDVGVLIQETCGNKKTLVSGLEATQVFSYQFSFDYSFNYSYNSDSTTLAGSVFRADISKT